MEKVEILSPAKLNFHLHVGDTRPDGFHEILSLFQAVDLYDRMEIFFNENSGSCVIEGDFPCAPEDNLIYKAVTLFRGHTGFTEGVTFQVDKKIPFEAGLGGGSSNAASALKILMKLTGRKVSREQLLEMAAELGSDVPFFFYGGAAAVSGRGEVVESLDPVSGFIMVLAKPESLGISTAQAYREVDLWRKVNQEKQSYVEKEDMIDQYLHGSPAEWTFYNTFFETFKKQYKPLEFISNLLYDSGAVFTGLSGSGSAVFGIFLTEDKAESAKTRLSEYFPFVERIISINSIPTANVI